MPKSFRAFLLGLLFGMSASLADAIGIQINRRCEGFVVIGSALADDLILQRALILCDKFLKAGFGVDQRSVLLCGKLCNRLLDEGQQEVRDRVKPLHTACVQIDCRQRCLKGIGNDGRLIGSATVALSLTQQQKRAESDPSRIGRQRLLAHQRGAHPRKISLRQLRKALI